MTSFSKFLMPIECMGIAMKPSLHLASTDPRLKLRELLNLGNKLIA